MGTTERLDTNCIYLIATLYVHIWNTFVDKKFYSPSFN